MSLDQLLIELQTEKLRLMRSAIASPSDYSRGQVAAMEMIINRIRHKKRAQVQVKLKLPFEAPRFGIESSIPKAGLLNNDQSTKRSPNPR